METFDLDEARAMLEPGDQAAIGAVHPLDVKATVATPGPLLIRSN
jgi:hypothetical protein